MAPALERKMPARPAPRRANRPLARCQLLARLPEGGFRRLVQRVFEHVEQLITHPKSGSVPRELRGSRYRQIEEPPCRVLYRYDGERVFILHVIRGERQLRPNRLRPARVRPYEFARVVPIP